MRLWRVGQAGCGRKALPDTECRMRDLSVHCNDIGYDVLSLSCVAS